MLDPSRYDTTVHALVGHHGKRLRALIGTRLETSWVAWEVADDDEWFQDEAVVLGFAEAQLEIACSHFDRLALTWGEIDTAKPPAHTGTWKGSFDLEWRPDSLKELSTLRGATLEGICVLEYGPDAAVSGLTGKEWLLSGLEFTFSNGTVQVFNALDQIGVATAAHSSYAIRHTEL